MSIPDNPDWSIPAVLAESPAAVVAVANPVAGAQVSYTFTSGTELLAVTANLVTSSAAANRIASAQLVDGSNNIVWLIQWANTQLANTSVIYELFPAAPITTTPGGIFLAPMPAGIGVSAGWKLTISAAGMQVTDVWQKATITGR